MTATAKNRMARGMMEPASGGSGLSSPGSAENMSLPTDAMLTHILTPCRKWPMPEECWLSKSGTSRKLPGPGSASARVQVQLLRWHGRTPNLCASPLHSRRESSRRRLQWFANTFKSSRLTEQANDPFSLGKSNSLHRQNDFRGFHENFPWHLIF